MRVLVVDMGTTSVGAAVVRPDGADDAVARQPVPLSTPNAGFVEVDAAS